MIVVTSLGKYNRGLMVIGSLKHLTAGRELSQEEEKKGLIATRLVCGVGMSNQWHACFNLDTSSTHVCINIVATSLFKLLQSVIAL